MGENSPNHVTLSVRDVGRPEDADQEVGIVTKEEDGFDGVLTAATLMIEAGFSSYPYLKL
jgi:hypothetical protein